MKISDKEYLECDIIEINNPADCLFESGKYLVFVSDTPMHEGDDVLVDIYRNPRVAKAKNIATDSHGNIMVQTELSGGYPFDNCKKIEATNNTLLNIRQSPTEFNDKYAADPIKKCFIELEEKMICSLTDQRLCLAYDPTPYEDDELTCENCHLRTYITKPKLFFGGEHIKGYVTTS